MGEPPYPTLALSQDLGERWPNVESARQLSNKKLAQLKDLLVDLDSDDTSIVVLGSLGRGEFTEASDIDWYLLVDGIADPHHHNLFLEADRRIKDFAQNDVSFWRADGHHIPHFLLNDLARFWRTMAVDFAHKLRARSGEKWAIRNVKLRMSRKLLYVAGLLACFHPHLLLNKPEAREQVYGDESFRPEIVEIIHSIFSDTPLDIVARLVSKLEEDGAVSQVFRAYDEFLGVLRDSDQRKHLETLSEAAESDPIYQKARHTSHQFRDGLLDLFFGKKLNLLTRQYGVF